MTATNLLPVIFSKSAKCVVDYVLPTGFTAYGKETFDQVKARYPDARILDQDTAQMLYEDCFKSAPRIETEDDFNYALEVLPPCRWNRGASLEYFHISERLAGNVVAWHVRTGRAETAVYMRFDGLASLNHDEIAHIVRQARISANLGA